MDRPHISFLEGGGICALACLLFLSGSVRTEPSHKFEQLPLAFEQNRGQAPSDVRYLARGQGYNLLLTSQGSRLLFRSQGKVLSVATEFSGANSRSAIAAEEKLSGKVHYLRGQATITDIPTYAKLRYKVFYPGIDLVYYGVQSKLEYDFVVQPKADPEVIAMRFIGADELSVNPRGDLVIRVGEARVVQHRPIAYQDINGKRTHVDSRYRLLGNSAVGFEVGGYDARRTLTIDPILSYSTFVGGSDGNDDGRGVSVDASGNVYLTGSTTSTNFQTVAPLQPGAGANDPSLEFSDAFVTKINSAGTAVMYSTYLGGASDDDGKAIAVDASGNAVVVGSTASTNFPTTAGAANRTCRMRTGGACADAFVAKLNPAGSSLIYSTYFGGTDDDEARGVALDGAGNAYVTGGTLSGDFPTTSGALLPSGNTGAYVLKFNPTGTLAYSTYLSAGSGTTESRGIAVDPSGNVYIAGATASSAATGTDVFLAKLNPSGTGLVFLQFIRGAKDDVANAVAVDSSGAAYVTGQTSSVNFATTARVLQAAFGGGPAFRSFDSGSEWSTSSSGLAAGSLHALAISKTQPSTIYAGADDETGGGVFKSVDGGANWTNVSAGISDARIHALATDPVTPGVVYAGSRSAGVFKSVDGGATWNATPLNNVFVTVLAIDPATPATVYAGAAGNGVYKSANAGASWVPVNNGLSSLGVRTLAIHPANPATIYAGTGGGIYRTTDAGASWAPVSSGLFDPNINAIVIDPRNPNLLFAATNSVGVFRSVNGGSFWLASNGGLSSSSLGILVSALTIDAGSGTLYAAIGESNVSRVYKSSNGITWAPTSLNTARITALSTDPQNGNAVYAATVGGSDAFLAKWNSSGSLIYSTYLGGRRDDAGNAIAVDSNGAAFVAGNTSSTDFPAVSPLQAGFGGGSDVVTDAFIAKVSASGGALSYSSYLGGSSNDFGNGVAVDVNGAAYLVGQTGSNDFPIAASASANRPGLLDVFVVKIGDTSSVSYAVPTRGGTSLMSTGSGGVTVGYGRIAATAGAPSGMAIFGFRQNNILVSEAAVPASPLISSGRIYAEVSGAVNTGVAVANPNNQDVTLSFYFTDAAGANFGSGSTTIPANGQIARFLNEAPFNSGVDVSGSFSFTASSPVSVVALRGLTNERSEFLITTLPVADLNLAGVSEVLIFPHYADGGGWTTQIAMVNPTDSVIAGVLQFSRGVNIGGQTSDTFAYSIPARSSRRLLTAGADAAIQSGSVRLTPNANNRAPAALGIFTFKNAGVAVSEAGVQAMRAGAAFRLYAESAGNFNLGAIGSMQTGVAIANASATPATVNFELSGLNGTSTGMTGSVSIPANGQAAMFLGQIPGFGALQSSFQGVLRASSASSIAVVGLRGRYNERRDFLITTTQPTIEGAASAAGEQFYPHFVDGGGYTTQFILFNGGTDQSSAGSLRFFGQAGQQLNLSLR